MTIWIFFVSFALSAATIWTEESLIKEIAVGNNEAMTELMVKKYSDPDRARIMVGINNKVHTDSMKKVVDLYERHIPFSNDKLDMSVRESSLALQIKQPFRLTPEKLLKALIHEYAEFRMGIIEAAGEISLKDKRYYKVMKKGLRLGYFERDVALAALWRFPASDMRLFQEELINCSKNAPESDHKQTCKVLLARKDP